MLIVSIGRLGTGTPSTTMPLRCAFTSSGHWSPASKRRSSSSRSRWRWSAARATLKRSRACCSTCLVSESATHQRTSQCVRCASSFISLDCIPRVVYDRIRHYPWTLREVAVRPLRPLRPRVHPQWRNDWEPHDGVLVSFSSGSEVPTTCWEPHDWFRYPTPCPALHQVPGYVQVPAVPARCAAPPARGPLCAPTATPRPQGSEGVSMTR